MWRSFIWVPDFISYIRHTIWLSLQNEQQQDLQRESLMKNNSFEKKKPSWSQEIEPIKQVGASKERINKRTNS